MVCAMFSSLYLVSLRGESEAYVNATQIVCKILSAECNSHALVAFGKHERAHPELVRYLSPRFLMIQSWERVS